MRRDGLVPAAAGAAAAAAAELRRTEARLRTGDPVRRERGELAGDLCRAAVGARRLLVAPDELLEVGLALHADVLVDRHGPSLAAHGAHAKRSRHPARRDVQRAGDGCGPAD